MGDQAFLQTGGCHCGRLRYVVTQRPVRTYVCHCTDCQALSGAAFGLGVVFRADAFTLTGSPKLVARRLGSGAIGNRWICRSCGVWVCGDAKLDQATGVERRIVRGGTFDDRSWIKPDAHLWTRSAQPWVVIPADVEAYPGNPGAPPEGRPAAANSR
jgi:hypothetical protein